jgi:hypothetical protein
MPHCFLGFNIFLATTMAIPAFNSDVAVKAVSFLSFFKMAHVALILLKIIKFTGLWVIGII